MMQVIFVDAELNFQGKEEDRKRRYGFGFAFVVIISGLGVVVYFNYFKGVYFFTCFKTIGSSS